MGHYHRIDIPYNLSIILYYDYRRMKKSCLHRHVMLCYIMSCHVMSCHVMSCHVILLQKQLRTLTSLAFSSLLFQLPCHLLFLSFHHIRLTFFLIILTSSLLIPIPTYRLVSNLPANDQEVYRLLKLHMSNKVAGSAYNWVRPSLWSALFSSKDRDKEK